MIKIKQKGKITSNKLINNSLIKNKLALLRKQEFVIPIVIIVSLLIAFSLFVTGVVINGTSSYSSTDINITQKNNGTIAFARLNISNTAPYDSLVGYWSFDFDNSTKAFDWTGNNNDGMYNGGEYG